MERDASTEQTRTEGLEVTAVGRGQSRPLYHTCAVFCTGPVSRQRPIRRGCVVTPHTRRTLPSENSTFVMSRSNRGYFFLPDNTGDL